MSSSNLLIFTFPSIWRRHLRRQHLRPPLPSLPRHHSWESSSASADLSFSCSSSSASSSPPDGLQPWTIYIQTLSIFWKNGHKLQFGIIDQLFEFHKKETKIMDKNGPHLSRLNQIQGNTTKKWRKYEPHLSRWNQIWGDIIQLWMKYKPHLSRWKVWGRRWRRWRRAPWRTSGRSPWFAQDRTWERCWWWS